MSRNISLNLQSVGNFIQGSRAERLTGLLELSTDAMARCKCEPNKRAAVGGNGAAQTGNMGGVIAWLKNMNPVADDASDTDKALYAENQTKLIALHATLLGRLKASGHQ